MITINDFINANLIVGSPNQERVNQFNEALAYLWESPTARSLLQAAIDTNVKIRLTGGEPVYHYDAGTSAYGPFEARTIEWDPSRATIYTNEKPGTNQDPNSIVVTGVVSAALMLIHEIGHAVDPNYLAGLIGDPQYGLAVERYATEQWEWPVALELGVSLRENHLAASYVFGDSSLNWVANPDGTYSWQRSLPGLTVLQGAFSSQSLSGFGSQVINSGTYSWENQVLTLEPNLSGLTLIGSGSLKLTENNIVITQGDFTIQYGLDSKQVSGKNYLMYSEGILSIDANNDGSLKKEEGSFVLIGSSGNDVLNGGERNDYLDGGTDNDELEGGAGNDILIGGTGENTLKGGAGEDVYYITASGENKNTIVETREADGKIHGQLFINNTYAGNIGAPVVGLFLKQEGDGNFWKSVDGTLTLTHNSPWKLVTQDGSEIELGDFQDGDYGIRLLDQDTPQANYDHVMVGDLAPIDQDSSQPGVQIGSDALGNVITDPSIAALDRVDTLYDSSGNDKLLGLGGDDTLNAFRGGDDLLDGGAGQDKLFGGSGMDTLVGGSGRDILNGGEGDDQIHGDEQADLVNTFVSDYGGSTVNGEYGDFLNGGEGNDTLVGSQASDALMGGEGEDVIIGGAGHDYIFGDGTYETSSHAWTFGYQPQAYPAADETYFPLYGGVGLDPVAGAKDSSAGGNDVIYGGSGGDFVLAGHGDDVVHGESGMDALDGGAGSDILLGGEDDDALEGDLNASPEEHGDDYLDLGEGVVNQYARGGGGNDMIIGGDTADTIEGDELRAGYDADYHGNDTIDGRGGNDTIWGEGGSDVIRGGSGNDYLEGDVEDIDEQYHGKDELYGESGNDTLLGDHGDDFLSGGADNDTLYGGLGNDIYEYSLGDGQDVIVEDGGNSDVLQLHGLEPTRVKLLRYWDSTGQDSLELRPVDADGVYLPGSILISNYFLADTSRIDSIEFDDGTVWDYQDIKNKFLMPSESNDGDLEGFSEEDVIDGLGGDDSLNGKAGNDTLFGGDGSDEVQGGLGNDTLYGGNGDDVLRGNGNWANDTSSVFNETGSDTLDGGAGNDKLYGARGDDTYIFGRGSGWDQVFETANAQGSSQDVLRLGEGVLPEHVTFYRVQENGGAADLVIVIDGSSDQIILNSYYSSTDNQIERIEFDGGAGPIWTATEIASVVQSGVQNAMTGTAGNDVFIVDHESDTISEIANAGLDTVEASRSFQLSANVENLTLTGNLNLTGRGNSLDNVLIGNANDNILDGSTGVDTAYGGEGNDTYYSVENIVELEDEGVDTFINANGGTLGANIENLFMHGVGSSRSAPASAIGNSLDNILTSSGVSGDVLNGREGADTMIAKGNGWVEFHVDNVGDRVFASANGGSKDIVYSSISYTLGDFVENLYLSSSNATWGYGNSLDNTLDSSGEFYSGSNTLAGKAGNDVYYIDATDNVIEQENEGIDRVIGQSYKAAGYSLMDFANVEELQLSNSAGNSSLQGNDLNNLLLGNSANNVLSGGGGADVLRGGGGNDTYLVNDAEDLIEDGSGWDRVEASISFTLTASVDELALVGVENINAYGNEFGNVIYGNDGDNLIAGNGGSDDLLGGLGSDTYIVNLGDGYTNISEIDGALYNNVLKLGAEFLPADLSITVNSNDLVITHVNGVDAITITDWFADQGGYYQLSSVEFDDGTIWTAQEITDLAISNISGTSDDDTLVGTDGYDDTIFGLDGNDTLFGLAGDDRLEGGAGNDILDGGAGSDELIGGIGADYYYVDSSSDSVIEFANEGTDTIEAGISWTLIANVENLKLTGDQSINAIGNSLNNALTGNSGANILDGGAGADTMSGGAGNDIYIVDNTSDVLNEASNGGMDSVETSVTYTLGSNLENLTLTGSNAINGTGNTLNNTLMGNSAANSLSGGSGNDVLDGGAGVDTLVGGAGNDTFYVDNSGDVITESSGQGADTVISSVSLTLGANVENLTLVGNENLNATGNTLNNVLTGNSGANNLNGGTGSDTMSGGLGDDVYIVNVAADVVNENVDEGIDTVQSSVTYTLSSNVENLTLTGTGSINGTGNSLNNTIKGTTAKNTLNGGDGDDILDGNGGTDTLVGGLGNDIYIIDSTTDVITENANQGVDSVHVKIATANGTYTLGSNVEKGVLTNSVAYSLTGNSLDNELTGNNLVNTLTGGSGNDKLDGLGGADILKGGAGDDIYVVDNVNDAITENANEGVDSVVSAIALTLGANVEALTLNGSSAINGTGNGLNNLLIGNAGVNTLTGAGGNDILQAQDGNDILADSSGNNVLSGGEGNDTHTGGSGNELFIGGLGNDNFTVGSGYDVLAFNKGDGADSINVNADADADNTISLGGGIDYADLFFSKNGNDLILKTGVDDSITLKDWYASTANRSVINLQVIAEAMADFSPNGTDSLRDNKIESFDFSALVTSFDEALSGNPSLNDWALTDTLLEAHLSGSDSEAIGGDLAYQYGMNGTLANIGLSNAQSVISDTSFGQGAQVLQPLASLQTGSVRLA